MSLFVPSITMLTFRFLYTEKFFNVVSNINTPSMVFVRKPVTQFSLFPRRANVTMQQDSLIAMYY